MTKRWSVAKEQQLVAACIKVNNLCNELGLAELIPMEAAKVVIQASRVRGVDPVRDFAERVIARSRSLSKLVH